MTSRQMIDLGALLLVLSGTGGLIACAFVHDRLLGTASIFAAVLVLGLVLGYTRDTADDDF